MYYTVHAMFITLLLGTIFFFLAAATAPEKCRPHDCRTNGNTDNFSMSLDCFNSTHLRVNWNYEDSATVELHLFWKQYQCSTKETHLSEKEGTHLFEKPSNLSAFFVYACGQYDLFSGTQYNYTISNISCPEPPVLPSSSPSLHSSLEDFSPLSSTLSSSFSTGLVFSSSSIYSTPTPATTSSSSHTTSIATITTSPSPTMQLVTTAIASSPPSPEAAFDLMPVLLAVALIIAVSTSALIVCTFVTVIVLIFNKRKKDLEINILDDVVIRDFSQKREPLSYNPPPRPFTQPLSVPMAPLPISRHSSTGDDSVFTLEAEEVTPPNRVTRKDSGFDETADQSLKNKDSTVEKDLVCSAKVSNSNSTDENDGTAITVSTYNEDTSGYLQSETSNNTYVCGSSLEVVPPMCGYTSNEDGYITNEDSANLNNSSSPGQEVHYNDIETYISFSYEYETNDL